MNRFAGDMNSAIHFHESELGLALRFRSAEWNEFDTGQTTLALHLPSPVELHGQRIAKLRDSDGAEFSVSGDR